MTILQVICPECSKKGDIEVSLEALKNVSKGLLAVHIPHDSVCSHSFIIYVDRNLKIRDYFMADFQFQLPEIIPSESVKAIGLTEEKLKDLSIVKLNLSATLLTYIIKSILLKKKILIISSESFINPLILDFFRIITQENFNFSISFISKESYDEKSKEFNDFMVFEGTILINNANNSLNPKQLKVEKNFIHNFLSEIDFKSSVIMLKNELHKAYMLSSSIVEIVQNTNNIEKINVSKLARNLEKSHKIKINSDYLDFLLDIVRDYFGFNVPSAVESFFKML
ncbi:MAG: hypothetical protein EU532_00490 [Promethearchaeota archaeon]|nr:MAG: hypothetical protein EU532_00490 [Candidatus Lokiarchaeota archaeon]